MREPDLKAEQIEQHALASLHQIATSEQKKALGLAFHWINGCWLSMASALPKSAIVINRCLGLGVNQPVERTQIEKSVARYSQGGLLDILLTYMNILNQNREN